MGFNGEGIRPISRCLETMMKTERRTSLFIVGMEESGMLFLREAVILTECSGVEILQMCL
jgi:hypothetical protein